MFVRLAVAGRVGSSHNREHNYLASRHTVVRQLMFMCRPLSEKGLGLLFPGIREMPASIMNIFILLSDRK